MKIENIRGLRTISLHRELHETHDQFDQRLYEEIQDNCYNSIIHDIKLSTEQIDDELKTLFVVVYEDKKSH